MFVLAEMSDTVKIPPHKFKKKLNEAIAEELNRKLSNKVFLNVGLCIALNDILSIGESYVFPGDGSSYTKVTFRYVIFRPFSEEVLVGKIRSCSSEGVHVSLGFFEDVIVRPQKLQQPARFDETEQLWVWEYEDADGAKHDLFMDVGEIVRFRIISETFTETTPDSPHGPTDATEPPTEAQAISPFTLEAGMDEPGLGCVSWWLDA